jgi:SET domain-containing protein
MNHDHQYVLKLIREQQTKLAPSLIPGAGVGLFALVDIPKDTLIKGCRAFREYTGIQQDYVIKESDLNGIDKKIKDYFWSMTDGEGDEFYIDAPPFMHYHGYYINHSSKPNCFWDRRTGDIYTQVDISEGQELTMYYKPDERDF